MCKLKNLVAATFRLRSLEKEGIKMRKLKSLGLLVVVVVCISAVSVFSAVPLRINYQGRYTENGTPVTGDRSFVFKIVDSDGSPVYWTSGSVTINLQNGLFNYVLEPTGVNWPNVEPYFEVWAGPSAGNETMLSPRERINASAYAIYASSAGYAFNALQSNENSTLQSGVTLFIDGEISTTGEAVTISTNVVVEGKVNILETGSSPAYYTIVKGGDQEGNINYTLPTSGGSSGNILTTDASGNLSWTSAGAGDVTAASNITDNRIVTGDGGAKGVQESLVTIDDTGHVLPNSDSAQDLGTSTTYWAKTYTDKLYLNPTAYLDGGTAGEIALYPAARVWIHDDQPELRFRESGSGGGRSLILQTNATDGKHYITSTYGDIGAYPIVLRMIATNVLTVGTDYGVNIGAGTAATALGRLGVDRLYLNSTAYLDGATDKVVGLTGALLGPASTSLAASSGSMNLSFNAYYDGSAWVRVASDTSTLWQLTPTQAVFYTGTNANPPVWTSRFILDSTSQSVRTGDSPTFTSLNLSATSNQIVLQSAGITTTLTESGATSNKVITFPNFTGTVYVTGGTDVAVADGGTNLSSIALGSILAANTANVLSAITSTSDLRVLQNNAGTISWDRPTKYFSIVIESPTTTDDFRIIQFPRAVTITRIIGRCLGGTNVRGMLYKYDTDGVSTATVIDTDSVPTANPWTILSTAKYTDTSLTAPSLIAEQWLGWDTISVSGTVNFVTVTVEYYEQ